MNFSIKKISFSNLFINDFYKNSFCKNVCVFFLMNNNIGKKNTLFINKTSKVLNFNSLINIFSNKFNLINKIFLQKTSKEGLFRDSLGTLEYLYFNFCKIRGEL